MSDWQFFVIFGAGIFVGGLFGFLVACLIMMGKDDNF